MGASIAVLSQGCESRAERGCAAYCDCVSCTDAELSGCIDDAEAQEDAADDAGCGDRYAEAADCIAEAFECSDTGESLTTCEAPIEALSTCMAENAEAPEEWLDSCVPVCEAVALCSHDDSPCDETCGLQYADSKERGCVDVDQAFNDCASHATDPCNPQECVEQADASADCLYPDP